MLCQKCGKNQANTYVKTIINGKLTEYSLCSECAKEMGYANGLSGFGFGDLLGGLLNDFSLSTTNKCCPKCGTTIDDITANGMVGCAECYNTFFDRLSPLIQRIHGTVSHKGKTPNRSALSVPAKNTEIALTSNTVLEQKKLQLKNAIEEQRFEDAAKLRDEIKEMNTNE